MIAAITALFAGVAVGVVFGILHLPVPAPPSIVGVLGIVGVWGGWSLVQAFLESR
jgi:XapX domain-containing protein